MSAADLASAGRPPAGGGPMSSTSMGTGGQQSGSAGLPHRFSPAGLPVHRPGQYNGPKSAGSNGPNGPFHNDGSSRSGTPSGNNNGPSGSRSGGPPEHYSNPGPTLAAPRPVPPYPRLTSPQPQEHAGRSPSPTKRSGPFPSGYTRDARERWASIGQVQGGPGGSGPMGPFDTAPPQRPTSGQPPFAGGAQDPFFGYGDFFGPSGVPGPNGSGHRDARPGGGPGADRGFSMSHSADEFAGGPGARFGHRGGDGGPFGGGHPGPNGIYNDGSGILPGPAPGSMSPRSMMHFHNHQMQAQQAAAMAAHGAQGNSSHQGLGAHSLGSGLMSNSGQPAEEITTVFIVGFPDDMTERELANMFLFAKGFEASTLKIPAGGPTPGSGSALQQRDMAGPNGPLAGAGGPYNAVNMPGAGFYDMGPAGGWSDDHALGMNLSRGAANDPFSMANMGNALGGVSTMPGGSNAAGKIKQIIGFAKFRTRAEALEARDALNGKKIDAERGCVLKTEMAKKNLHTKQKPVLPGGSNGPLEGPYGGPFQQGLPGGSFHASGDRDMLRQSGNSSVTSAGPFASSLSPTGTHSYDSYARAAGPPSASLSGMISPQGADPPSYAGDVFGRSRAAGGLEPAFGATSSGASGAPSRTPGEGPLSAAADKWNSIGPLDYFGPVSENKRGDDLTHAQPHSASLGSALSQQSSSHQAAPPRGPDWSAIGSPPGLFSTSRPFGTETSRSAATTGGSTISPSKQSNSSSSSSNHANHHSHPYHYTSGKEDFGMGEPMTTISTPTTSRGQGSRRDTRSTTSGGSFSGSPTKAGLTNKSTAGSAGTSPPSANETPQSSLSTSSQNKQAAAVHGGNNGQAASAFASRFGSLRLDSSQETIDRPGTSPEKHNLSGSAGTAAPPSSSGPKSPVDLPSPTSRSFSIDQNPPGNTLFVGNLPSNTSASHSASLEDQLRQRFSACAGYRQLSFRVKNNGPMCFVEFDDVQNAARALAEVNGDSMNGAVKNGGLRLSFSKNPLFRNSCSGNATIGGAATPTSSTPTPPVPAGSQFTSLGKLGESLRKQQGGNPGAAPSVPKSNPPAAPSSQPNIDPFDSINTLEESAYREGFSAGSAHGKLHGTFEGRQLGREKGFEIWDEVGFYEGTARFWKGVLTKQVEKVPAHMRSRKQVKQLQHLNGLETLIAAFPIKNRSGAAAAAVDGAPLTGTAPDSTSESGDANGEGTQDDPEALAKLDMSVLLERIRARYKVVCASLGIPARGLEGEPRSAPGAESEAADSNAPGGSATPTPNANTNKNAAVIGGKIVDTTQLRF